MPSNFFSFENDIFTLSLSSSSSNYKIVIVINTLTTMNNQFETLNAPKIDLPFFFFHSYELNTTYLSLSLHIQLKKPKILILHFLWFIVIEANDSGYEIDFFPDLFVQTISLGSRLAVDDLPGSRLVNAEVSFAIDFEICFLRRLKVKSSLTFLDDLHFSRLNKKLPNEEKLDIKTYQNAQIYYERETSSEDFQEV
ncbi:hypothetical protein IGI04_034461 [Brassica rapa subsp. trilocularis]|uniref:Uncharacterized protein n=1 Tax=Brassica rapa subsp. trilocularis TaxID=1813537 RepID=A0ABQ7LB22_BRACM|nr:hypothetical protein IGI04_034461 [Brassica rapa subsp. trilocularis]